jgi:hypothetical protein
MSNKAPYKMWSIQALKNEAIQRGMDKSKVDKADKAKLVSTLTKMDADAAAAPKAKPVAKKAAKPAAAPAVKPVTKKVAASKEKTTKPQLPSSGEVNEQLRKKGLWLPGMQFISKEMRMEVLSGDPKAVKRVTKHLEGVMSNIKSTLSEKMTTVMADRKAQGLPVGRQAGSVSAPKAPAKPAPKPAAKAPAKPAPKPAAKAPAKPAPKTKAKVGASDADINDLF